MRNATRIVATALGITAGLAGLEHGYFEILQGNVQPPSLMFASMGPPCVAEQMWHGCEPALSIIPNFIVTGILALLFGLVILIWSAAFVQRKNGGSILMLLSFALLLFGGGIIPPVIGFISGIVGNKINKPLAAKPSGSILGLAEKAWPWPLVIYLVWILGQFVVGALFNDFLKSIMGFALILTLAVLPLSIYTGYAVDAHSQKNTL